MSLMSHLKFIHKKTNVVSIFTDAFLFDHETSCLKFVEAIKFHQVKKKP